MQPSESSQTDSHGITVHHRMTAPVASGRGNLSHDSPSGSLPRLETDRSRSRGARRPSVSTAASSASPHNSDRSRAPLGKIGVCALDGKARSKPSRNILTRLQTNSEFEVIVFGDKVILDEDVENWPLCDYLISFFSDGFPLDKAIAYAQLRKPFCVNDLPMQKILWDRRLCLRILDHLGVPTPTRIEVNRDGGPVLESDALAEHVGQISGVKFRGPNSLIDGNSLSKNVELIDDGDTLVVDGLSLKKPFVEKPVSGEDHNICIYFPKSAGGGGRRLFRKIGNKSSEWIPDLVVPRSITETTSSYIYEQFLDVENAEDVKAYTVGTEFCHAETRKSPVVDGLVRRNTHGKEIRYVTSLSAEEAAMASKIALGFGQRICGFDLLRAQDKSFVIDVNGWSFVKDNNEYYDKCSRILRDLFIRERERFESIMSTAAIDVPAELPVETPKPTLSSHREALKGIFRSRSLTKLRGPLHSRKAKENDSPETFDRTTPMSSPPTTERPDDVPFVIKGGIPEIRERSTTSVEAQMSTIVSPSADRLPLKANPPLPAAKHSWKLKGMVAVIRHADRTPKQKFKFTFHTQPFIELLKGHQEEVLLKGEAALSSVVEAVEKALQEGIEDRAKLNLLKTTLVRKGSWHGTKVQIKPMFRKRTPEEIAARLEKAGTVIEKSSPEAEILEEELHLVRTGRSDSLTDTTLSRYAAAENDLVLDKLQLVMKWGGEPTHSARYQAQDLGENMRNDLLLMNRDVLGDVRIFTSSEPRVSTSAQIWAASFLDQQEVPDSFISVRKDLLDDSNAAKDVMDKVKKKLKLLLRAGHEPPKQFAWPPSTPEPSIVVRKVIQLMQFHRKVMRHNFKKLDSISSAAGTSEHEDGSVNDSDALQSRAEQISKIQARWCTGEDADLFKERWEKLFNEFADAEKVDPSKISELYDTMKYDALHNRPFLEWAFTPSSKFMEEMKQLDEPMMGDNQDEQVSSSQSTKPPLEKIMSEGGLGQLPIIEKLPERKQTTPPSSSTISERTRSSDTIAQRMGFRRRSMLNSPPSPVINVPSETTNDSYFKLYNGCPPNSTTNNSKHNKRLHRLRELYKLAKILFDFICPQEYGISDSEKLEIGLLTSLPLLQEIVSDLEEVQASESAKSFIYFTKESHVYTLLNAILGGGIRTKIARNAIPELDYLSQIVFELYEASDREADSFAYSIKITITPGCHTADPLDVLLDSKHSIGCAPRRSLTAHQDWKEVIETLRAKFHTVCLPKSFLAVNLSEWHAREMRRNAEC